MISWISGFKSLKLKESQKIFLTNWTTASNLRVFTTQSMMTWLHLSRLRGKVTILIRSAKLAWTRISHTRYSALTKIVTKTRTSQFLTLQSFPKMGQKLTTSRYQQPRTMSLPILQSCQLHPYPKSHRSFKKRTRAQVTKAWWLPAKPASRTQRP